MKIWALSIHLYLLELLTISYFFLVFLFTFWYNPIDRVVYLGFFNASYISSWIGVVCLENMILNFPSFFKNAIRRYSSLSQVDAVNVLLCGVTGEGTIERVINDSTASWYASGKRAIRKDILTKLLALSNEEVVRRVHMLGIQDIQKVVNASEVLVREDTDLSITTKESLLSRTSGPDAGYDFVAKVFLYAVKGNLKPSARPDGVTIQSQTSRVQSGQSMQLDKERENNSTAIGLESETEEEGGGKFDREPFPYSHEAIEVSVSYRPLSMPEDKEPAISELLSRCEGSFINIDRDDAEVILSGADGAEYFWAEVRGSCKGISFELSKWRDLLFCTGALVQVESNPDAMDIEKFGEITNSISYTVCEDANVIWGTKFTDETGPDQIHLYGIFQIQRTPVKSDHAVGKSDLHLKSAKPDEMGKKEQTGVHADEMSHLLGPSKAEEDPYDEIFRIFNKGQPDVESSMVEEEVVSHDEPSRKIHVKQPDVKPSDAEEEVDPYDEIFRIFSKK